MIKNLVKKFSSVLLLTAITAVMAVPTCGANNPADLVVEFSNFSYTTSEYSPNQVLVEYENDENYEKAFIKDQTTDKILETITVEKPVKNAEKLHTFTRSRSYGDTKVEMAISVEMYSEGSFRQINRIISKTLQIPASVTETIIEDGAACAAVSTTDCFPTDSLYFSYSGSLLATVDTKTDEDTETIEKALLTSGFSIGGRTKDEVYYRRTFDNSGKISVY